MGKNVDDELSNHNYAETLVNTKLKKPIWKASLKRAEESYAPLTILGKRCTSVVGG